MQTALSQSLHGFRDWAEFIQEAEHHGMVNRSTINDEEFFTLCDVCTKPLRPQTPRLRLRYVGFKGIGDALA